MGVLRGGFLLGGSELLRRMRDRIDGLGGNVRGKMGYKGQFFDLRDTVYCISPTPSNIFTSHSNIHVLDLETTTIHLRSSLFPFNVIERGEF